MGKTFITDPETDMIQFATTGNLTDVAEAWNDTAPTSSVISIGSSALGNASGQACIGYAFAEIQGFSKIGYYSGTGNSKGTKVYCGFRPKWIMIKSTTTGDNFNSRVSGLTGYGLGGSRTRNINLNNNESNAEGTIQYESNGFRMASTSTANNQEDTKYLYIAFAEMPMVSTNGTIALAT